MEIIVAWIVWGARTYFWTVVGVLMSLMFFTIITGG